MNATVVADAATARAILAHDVRAVAAHLRQRGWIKNNFAADDGVCLMQAIGEAIPADRSSTVHRVIDRHLHEQDNAGVLGWNDTLCEDVEQAVGMLLALADQLDGRCSP